MELTKILAVIMMAFVGAAPASATPLTVPEGTEDISENLIWLFDTRIAGSPDPDRGQILIPRTAFSNFTGFVAISAINLRPSRIETDPFTFTIPRYDITASTTQLVPDDLVVDLDDNLSFNKKLVRSGPLALSSNLTGSPRFDYDMQIEFDSPFLYNPASGNLLFDISFDRFIGTAPLAAAHRDASLEGYAVVQSFDPDGTPVPTIVKNSSWLSVYDVTGNNLAANLVAGSPTALTQAVDVGNEAFTFSFDYRFETITGELSVLLGDVSLGTITAPSSVLSDFTTAEFLIDGPLLGQTDQVLEFRLDGPSGSSLFLDNVNFPNLVNGEFADQLVAWTGTSSGTGSTGVQAISSVIPEPVTLSVLTLGLVTLTGRQRRMN